ncbi:MAG: XdhC/CoxF family protein [Desulfovibrio sp.]|uniref:XdhC family protein n=1 Tax=Desulfovibrio sp. TaxID=885 RepID=UPI001A6F1F02|nr:XdhC family protein [Desulfovibrio sp.]MBD5417957.1 XdhC/CoxF family protein [Desulfovibrio sp.]
MDSAEKHSLLGEAPLTLTPAVGDGATPDGADMPVLLLLGDGPEARALARLAAECGFAVDMAVWGAGVPQGATDGGEPGEADAAAPDIPGLRRHIRLLPGESPVERCAVGRRHYVCIFPPDEETAESALEDVLSSHAFYVGLWATRAERELVWGALRAAGVPDAELAAVRCPLGLGDLADMGGPMASAVPVLAELLAARAGSRQRFRLED